MKVTKSKRYEVRSHQGSSNLTALRFDTLDEAQQVYHQWAESGCYGHEVLLIDHRLRRDPILESTLREARLPRAAHKP